MKRVLIISPYFPPVNAADMQRVRMSLPYFAEFGWEAEVVTVDPAHADMAKDDLLLESVPPGIKIHQVEAFSKSLTMKFKLGSLALRSLWFYKKKVDYLLGNLHYDLIYFSTTQFPVCILGAYWKKKFSVPYIIDMQDPWHSDYYKNKPKNQQPPKYWAAYRMNKYLEAKAMTNVDGLISVSERYPADLKQRYPVIKKVPTAIIPFGAAKIDFEIADRHRHDFPVILDTDKINVVCIGRGGLDLHKAITPVFKALSEYLKAEPEIFGRIKFYFIGTSYAAMGHGRPTILPLAKQYKVEAHVVESTDRISYYHTLSTLQQADGLFIPGSDDAAYTPSKISPYLAIGKPLLAIFHPDSKVLPLLKNNGADFVYDYETVAEREIKQFFLACLNGKPSDKTDEANKYSARQFTLQQCELFDVVLAPKNHIQ